MNVCVINVLYWLDFPSLFISALLHLSSPSSCFLLLPPSFLSFLQSLATDDVPPILDALFECTLDMINKDLEVFPEHRTNFFRMLQSVTAHCFSGNVQTSRCHSGRCVQGTRS